MKHKLAELVVAISYLRQGINGIAATDLNDYLPTEYDVHTLRIAHDMIGHYLEEAEHLPEYSISGNPKKIAETAN